MTPFVDIKPGQWVLAFDQPYGPYDRIMEEHLEMFAQRGGGWESDKADEIFIVHQVEAVSPKTYMATSSPRGGYRRGENPAGRYPRSHVVTSFGSKAAALAFRDKFFAIGIDVSDRIEAEMYRRIQKFAARERAKAINKVHKLLPQHFGREA